MKNILLVLFLFALPAASFGQNRTLNKFYRQHKKGREVKNIKLPGWLLRTGGKIAIKKSNMNREGQELVRQLIKKAGKIRVMYSEDGTGISKKDIRKLEEELSSDDFSDLIMVKSGSTDFQLMIQETGGVVKSLFLLFNDLENGEMAFVTIKMKLKLNDVREIIQKGMKEHYHEIMELEEEKVAEPII